MDRRQRIIALSIVILVTGCVLLVIIANYKDTAESWWAKFRHRDDWQQNTQDGRDLKLGHQSKMLRLALQLKAPRLFDQDELDFVPDHLQGDHVTYMQGESGVREYDYTDPKAFVAPSWIRGVPRKWTHLDVMKWAEENHDKNDINDNDNNPHEKPWNPNDVSGAGYSTSTDNFIASPLFGSLTKTGEYSVSVKIGAQYFRVQVDSGSSLLAVAMEGCSTCRADARKYKPYQLASSGALACNTPRKNVSEAFSRTPFTISSVLARVPTAKADTSLNHTKKAFEPLCYPIVGKILGCPALGEHDECCTKEREKECAFFVAYGDGSKATGSLLKDDFRVMTASPPTIPVDDDGRFAQPIHSLSFVPPEMVALDSMAVPVYFGGVMKDTAGFEKPGVDGILGLAYPPLACNPTCVEPVFDAMVREQVVESDMFSVCITSDNGGVLILGGHDKNMLAGNGQLQWAPMTPVSRRQVSISLSEMFYSVTMKNMIEVGLEALPIRWEHGIVDSGTTLIVMTPSAFDVIRKEVMRQACQNKVPGTCVGGTTGPGGARKFSASGDREFVELGGMEHGAINHESSNSSSPGPSNEYSSAEGWFRPAVCVSIPMNLLKLLPSITFHLSPDVKLTLGPEEYMVEYKVDNKVYRCVGIMTLAALEKQGIDVILGNTIMTKYVTVYDRTNRRIGFGEAAPHCGAMGTSCEVLSGSCSACKEAASLGCMWKYTPTSDHGDGTASYQCLAKDFKHHFFFPYCSGW
eukprot:CAMPEP_0184705960 /NCGR_PEP_ID=MMETSP0313-20130426/36097_1 /TAXON_ID=2792 /ORGANISM="Porphyridium aerugineum, Strain SAG 1380-2" /LENGTH=748 /DNA_ID=CAMNT_0027167451 /DNA_START=52 /DNA_END=2295 /DNA_ORIENTATION=+